MKKLICLAFCLSALAAAPVWGQVVFGNSPSWDTNRLTSFNLDFPGGTPAELVKSIESATGKPLNAIIPTEDADIQLPPLKMNDVFTPQLFTALGRATIRYVAVNNMNGSYSQNEEDYSFQTSDNPITDTSIWYFYAEKPTLPPVNSAEPTCRFFQLQSYLNHGFTVDDITTAVQTGWKMAGITSPPELNYHKETNLLIAFGKPDELDTIQNVLNTLPGTYLNPGELNSLVDHINKLESQVSDLTQKVSALSEKNSGK